MSEYRRVGGRTYKVRVYNPDDSDGIMEDGEMLVCPTFLMDAGQREVVSHFKSRRAVSDALASHNAGAGHRPGFVTDTLCQSATATVNDASDDLVERRGTALADAMLERQRALAETEQRQQWRTTLDARVKVEPESDDADDDDESELVGSAEYGKKGDYEYQPDDDNGDDDENDVFKAPREYKQKGQYGSGEYGHSGGAPDASGLRAPEDDRERARIERDQRGNQAWRNGSAVSRANANQRQLERWRGK
jgi:hypothetical protein